MMTVGSLKRILSSVPDEASICLPCGEDNGCVNIGDARFFQDFNILYLSSSWPRSFHQRCVKFNPSTGEMIKETNDVGY